jgi:hypothetical protein
MKSRYLLEGPDGQETIVISEIVISEDGIRSTRYRGKTSTARIQSTTSSARETYNTIVSKLIPSTETRS